MNWIYETDTRKLFRETFGWFCLACRSSWCLIDVCLCFASCSTGCRGWIFFRRRRLSRGWLNRRPRTWFSWHDRNSFPQHSSVSTEEATGWCLNDVIPIWSNFLNDCWGCPLLGDGMLNYHVISYFEWLKWVSCTVVMLDLEFFCSSCLFFQYVSFLLPFGCKWSAMSW